MKPTLMSIPFARCSGVRFSMRFWAAGDRSICCSIKRCRSTFCTTRIPGSRTKMLTRSHGTHQLGLRLRSENVFLGSMKTFTRRCGSESPPPAGSRAVAEGSGADWGVGLIGELIHHPTYRVEESYAPGSTPMVQLCGRSEGRV